MCKELGVAQKSSSTNIKKKKSDEFSVEPAEDTIGEPFLEYYLGLSSNAVLTFWNYMIYFPILIYLYWQENTGIIITICRRQLIKSFGVKQVCFVAFLHCRAEARCSFNWAGILEAQVQFYSCRAGHISVFSGQERLWRVHKADRRGVQGLDPCSLDGVFAVQAEVRQLQSPLCGGSL